MKIDRNMIDEIITSEIVCQFNCADWGETLGLYYDDEKGLSTYIGQSVGMEIAENERPIATMKVPGHGNIDTAFWTDGWIVGKEDGLYVTDDGRHLTLAECIADCCENGDVEELREEIVDRLWEDYEEEEY